jgi:cob(I)alamin adenosyltransferase
MSVYTRTGDAGMTSLFGGKRVPKSDSIIDFLGSLDELSGYIGLVSSLLKESEEQRFLQSIQKDLLSIGSVVSGGKKAIHLVDRVKEMEKKIDEMEKKLPQLHAFILPGGTVLTSQIHIARSICRRAERKAVSLKKKTIFAYLNRLSDYLFVFARFVNHKDEGKDNKWGE